MTILNDIAFYLNTENIKIIDLNIDESKFNVGLTIKYVDKNKAAEYRDMMVEAIKHCIDTYNAVIYIYPHVTIENDIDNSYEIFNRIDDKYKNRIIIFNGNYSARDLKALYSLMDIFIGTRLHSTIFAMGEMVPSICISYHGTKALGIFSNYGLEEYVILDYSSKLLISKIDALISNKNEIENILQKMHDVYKVKFMTVFKEIL
jgi:colanic acid/amylovoran biosynthesis protein